MDESYAGPQLLKCINTDDDEQKSFQKPLQTMFIIPGFMLSWHNSNMNNMYMCFQAIIFEYLYAAAHILEHPCPSETFQAMHANIKSM